MSVKSRLVDVSFEDSTSYVTTSGTDAMGVPFDHPWGPVNKLMYLNQSDFFSYYPESFPCSATTISPSRHYAYAQIKKAFSCGADYCEVYRVQGSYQYQEILLQGSKKINLKGKVLDTYTPEQQFVKKQFTAISANAAIVSTKYPGFFPQTLTEKYDGIALHIVAKDKSIDITIHPMTKSADQTTPGTDALKIDEVYYDVVTSVPFETYSGSIDPNSTDEGRSNFIETLINAKSSFISVKVNPDYDTLTELDAYVGFTPLNTDVRDYPAEPTEDEWKVGLDAFIEGTISNATLIISPSNNNLYDEYILNIANSRQDLQALCAYSPLESFDKASILTAFQKLSGSKTKFGIYLAAREDLTIFGQSVASSCAGGWVGTTFNIAKSVRTNQPASAFTYGGYSGSLAETLTFDEVCDLHEEGILSIFESSSGSMIWGVRSMHQKQGSYFGKLNVMRVLCKILRNVFPICLDAIHTDAASNPITRATYNVNFNQILATEIAAQNIASDSYADCGDDVNADKNTNGGEIFNLNLVIHFYKVVERVKIKVTATDSSVTATIE